MHLMDKTTLYVQPLLFIYSLIVVCFPPRLFRFVSFALISFLCSCIHIGLFCKCRSVAVDSVAVVTRGCVSHLLKSISTMELQSQSGAAVARRTEVALSHFPFSLSLNEAFVTLCLSHLFSLSCSLRFSHHPRSSVSAHKWRSQKPAALFSPTLTLKASKCVTFLRPEVLTLRKNRRPSCGLDASRPSSPPCVWGQGSSRTELSQPAAVT